MITLPQKKGRTPQLGYQAYQIIREKMITLEFAPGMKLEEKDLMDRLKLGRTPIREAVKMLISEGLVVSYGSNATYVKDLTVKSAKDVAVLISNLGAVAFNLANPSSDFKDIIEKIKPLYSQMNERIQKGDVKDFCMLNSEFHRIIFKVADNEFLEDIVEKLYFHETRLAFVVSLSLGDKRESKYKKYYETIQDHHKKFIDYLEKKDFEKLKDLYKEHNVVSRERMVAYFAGDF